LFRARRKYNRGQVTDLDFSVDHAASFGGFENWDHALNLQHNYKLDVEGEGYKTRRFPAVASGSIGERSLTAEIKNGRPQVKERGNVCSAIGRWSHNCRLTGEPNPCFVDCAEEPG